MSSGGSGGSEPVDEFWDDEFSLPTTGRPEVKVVANGVRSSPLPLFVPDRY